MSTEQTNPAAGNSSAPHPDVIGVTDSTKEWLALLTLVVIATGVLICVVAFQNYPPGVENGNTDGSPGGSDITAGDGPWGQLEYIPIVISPPLEYAAEAAGDFSAVVVWHFPNVGSAGLSALFREIGLAAPLIAELESMAKANVSLPGMSIYPPKQECHDTLLSPQGHVGPGAQ